MGDKNNWIVLINKVPRGPLSEQELRSLLNLGVVRLNDVAYQVDPQNPKTTSEWRFLWQFNEFDRRKPDEGVSNPGSAPMERRDKVDEQKLRKKISETVPEELRDIMPEELIMRGKTSHERSFEDVSDAVTNYQTVSANRRFAVVGVIMFMVFLGTYGLYTGKAIRDNLTAPAIPAVPAATIQVRAPAARANFSIPALNKETARTVRPQKAIELPKAQDNGEVSQDQVKRLEEDRKESDRRRKEDEERYSRDEDEEEEEEAKPEKKKKKKREVTNDEELEEAIDEGDEEATD